MIKSIRLQNFFGFQDCTVNLEPGANVLIGINGSGKSNFLKAFKILENGIQIRNFKSIVNEFGGANNFIFKGSNQNKFALTFDVEPELIKEAKPKINQHFKFQLHFERVASAYVLYEKAEKLVEGKPSEFLFEYSNGEGNIRELKLGSYETRRFRSNFLPGEMYLSAQLDETVFPDITLLQEELSNIYYYTTFETNSLSDIRKSLAPVGDSILDESGYNLVQVLNYLKINNRSSFQNIVNVLRDVNPNFEDIEFINLSNQLELHLLEKGNFNVPPQLISDGTLRFLCLMAILYNPNRGSIVCIDEPELGLHPDMILTLYEAIKYASQTSQVIISTHSPQLLDCFDLNQVIVFEKNEKNATVVKQGMKEEDFSAWKDDYYPGKMWRSGAIGGNR